MATYYIDFEGGNDANAGTSFATRWKTITSGATAARIAPGDVIRIMASPDPTDVGQNATWTQATVGNRPQINVSTASNTTPIRITTGIAHGRTTGDTVFISGVNTNLRANGVWRVTVISSTQLDLLNADGTNSTPTAAGSGGTMATVTANVVTLTTPVTQNIALCGNRGTKGNWVPSANVTQSEELSLCKEGVTSQNIAINATFTTGKTAYFTLPSALNLSGFQQVCFWIRQVSGTVGVAGATYVALCSDTLGDTVVHTCNTPALGGTGRWYPVVINFGAALSTSIQSVAFYVATDNGAQTFILDNIFASKAVSDADSINLTSLISKNTADETWFSMMSVNANRLVISGNSTGQLSATFGSQLRGYEGATATQTLFKRETIPAPAGSTIQDSGSITAPIVFSGGWNRTDMSTRTGETWLDGFTGFTDGISDARTNITVTRVNPVRYNNGYFLSDKTTFPKQSTYSDFTAVGCNSGVNISGYSYALSNFIINLCSGGGDGSASIRYTSVDMLGITMSNGSIRNAQYPMETATSFNTYTGRNVQGSNITLRNCYNSPRIPPNSTFVTFNMQNCYSGVLFADTGRISGGSATGTSNQVLFNPLTYSAEAYVDDYVNSTAGAFWGNMTTGGNQVLYSNRQANTNNNHFVYSLPGNINFQTAVTDAPAIGSWRFAPGSTATSLQPLQLKLGTVVCAAGSPVTVTARMQRNNTLLTMQLVCPGGQLPGVSTVSSSMTAAANTWETVSITFTPTSAGGVDIFAYGFPGAVFLGYVCNMTATQ